MYQVTIHNGSQTRFQTSDGKQFGPGETWTSGFLGDGYITSVQGGTLSLIDIADQRIPGDTSQTWGVLIGYQGEEYVGRYEGGGALHVEINRYLQMTLSGNMGFRQVYLPGLIVTT